MRKELQGLHAGFGNAHSRALGFDFADAFDLAAQFIARMPCV